MVLYHTYNLINFFKIGTLAADLPVKLRKYDARLSPVFRSFFLCGMPALLLLKFSLCSSQVSEVFCRFARRNKDSEVIDAYVYPDGRIRCRSVNWRILNAEAGIPFVEFSFDRAGFDISNDRAVKLCLDGSYLGKFKTLRRYLKPWNPWIIDGVVLPYTLKPRVTGIPGLVFNPAKEILKGPVNAKQNILQDLGMDAIKGIYSGFVALKDLLLSYPGKPFAGFSNAFFLSTIHEL